MCEQSGFRHKDPPQDIWQEGISGNVGSARRRGSERIENLATKLRLTNQSRVTNAAGGPMAAAAMLPSSRPIRRC